MTYIVNPKGESLGKIVISDTVLQHIVVVAIQDLKHVFFEDGSGKKSISLNKVNKNLVVDVKIKVQYGQNVEKTCEKVQESLTQTLDLMVDCPNPIINVTVTGFKFN